MKIATTIVAALVTLLGPAGPARAQQWGGVAGVAASQGYAAAPGMGMTVPVPAEPEATPPAEDHGVTPAAPSPRAPRMAQAQLRTDRHPHPRLRIARTAAHHRPAMLARAKRPFWRRPDRFA